MTMGRLLLAIAICATFLAGCKGAPEPAYQGYAEGEFVLVAAPYAGALTQLGVARGQQVAAGAPLFELEQASELAARRESEERLRAALGRVSNLRDAQRTAQLQALEAGVAKAKATLALSDAQLRRDERLVRDGFISLARLDEGRGAQQRDTAELQQAQAQLAFARQSLGRPGELDSARAEAGAAEAVVAQAAWRVDQKAQRAPAAALVHETFYVPGEWVPAGKPVVSLLPPGNVKVRFFVPETEVGRLKLGAAVQVSCDGCGEVIPAVLGYVSSRAEYTPPVIYSRESRAKLVFMAEARPSAADAARLKPGQPVDVRVP
jgi:HlyD family secretion protein